MFRRFFQGRYGADQLSHAMIICAFLLYIPLIFLARGSVAFIVLYSLLIALILLALLRMLSRKYEARQRENAAFMRIWYRVSSRFSRTYHAGQTAWHERRVYKHLTCPQCAQKLRVPRGKGRLRVTCTRCGNRFETKS